MANSSLFDGLILSFDDANDLQEWATEFGHLDEPIVQEHIAFLRNRSESMDANMDIVYRISFEQCKSSEGKNIIYLLYIFSYFQVSNI